MEEVGWLVGHMVMEMGKDEAGRWRNATSLLGIEIVALGNGYVVG